jgi:hypothetical protein
MSELRFQFKEMQLELEAIRNMARQFLTRDSDLVFQQLRAQLENIARRPGRQSSWTLAQDTPLRTQPSHGRYERSGKGSHDVVGTLSFVWEITAEPNRRVFALTGNASTVINLSDVATNPPTPLGTWRMEVGDAAAPGCCFHAQILGQNPDPPFPRSLPIPRLPVLPSTPMVALEFLLGELFQTDWSREVGTANTHTRLWAGVQAKRLAAYLRWQQTRIEQAPGSPWIALKAFPGDIFEPAAASGIASPA